LPLALSEISRRLGAELLGGDTEVGAMAPLDSAGPEDLSLCVNQRLLAALRRTRAGGVLMESRAGRKMVDSSPCPVILVGDLRLALARVLAWLYPRQSPPAGIMPGALVASEARVDPRARIEAGAVIGPGAVIGAGTLVGSGACVGAEVEVGRDCLIGANAVIEPGCRLGERVRLGAGVVIGAAGFGVATGPQGPESIPQVGGVVIEDEVELGANCTVDRATLGVTRIGRGCKLDDQVHVGHNAVIEPGCVIAAQCGISGSVHIGAGAVLGGQVGVADHAVIGAGAQIGAKSGVAGTVPAGARVAGIPAIEVGKWLSGLMRLRRLGRRRPAGGGD